MTTLVWFRGKDLRLADHEPLRAALEDSEVIPLFVADPSYFRPGRAAARPHRMQFLCDSLAALDAALQARGSRLLLVHGEAERVVPEWAARVGAGRVVAQRATEPSARARDADVGAALGCPLELYAGETLLPPQSLRSGAGTPYAVFTRFAQAFAAHASIAAPLPAPSALPALPRHLSRTAAALPTCESLGLPHNPRVQPGGERAARARLKRFLAGPAREYDRQRDRLDRAGTSRLSADLKFGTLSVRSVWTAALRALGETRAARSFLNELVWREFTHSTLWDRPTLLQQPFRAAFTGFPYRDDPAAWRAWVAGETGYPIVDASARQLLCEGFVHNRARMISASFLTKHLLIDYRRGEAHYKRYLTDGDAAQNNAGWQWSAGCGCDAQPYFRVFNPVLQGTKFDPDGAYVRRYVPELAHLPARYIHQPWRAPAAALREARVQLGRDYPAPIVEHGDARARFLALARDHLRATD